MKALVHLANGKHFTVEQPNVQAATDLLKNIRFAKFFESPSFILATPESVTITATQDIDFIIFRDCSPPERVGPKNVESMEVITPEQFATAITDADRLAGEREKLKPGDINEGYLELKMRSGEVLHLKFRSTLRQAVEQMMLLRNLLTGGALLATTQSHGFVLVNLSATSSLTAFPGTRSLPPEAWRVRKVTS